MPILSHRRYGPILSNGAPLVIIGEPPRTQADLNFHAFGIPIRIHPMFWVLTLLLGMRYPEPEVLLAWLLAVLISILIHELGHAMAFRYYGVASYIVLYSFGGLAIPMQEYGRPKLNHIVISAAGPAAQLLAATMVGIGLTVAGYGVPLVGFIGEWLHLFEGPQLSHPFAHYLVQFFLYVSVYWALLNLLPIYPLDGGQISRELFLKWDRTDAIKHSLMLSIIAAGAIAFRGLLGGSLFIGIMFGYLAYSNYQALLAHSGSSGGYRQRW